MRLLNTLLLLISPTAPTTGVAAGAMYFDSATGQPLYFDGSSWQSFGVASSGFPEIVAGTYTIPDNRQVTYFDRFQNDGVLSITGTGTLVGMR